MSEPTSESESTRHLAEQRLPETHFQTPTWLGPDRHPDAPRPTIPEQASPTHDDAVPPPKALLDTAHWVGSTTGRTAMTLMLVAGAMVTLGAGALTLREQTADSVILLAICAVVTVGIWALMAAMRPMVVDLKGPMLTVRHHDVEDIFNLADPYQQVEIRGSLGSPTWALVLGRRDGSTVVVGSKTVPPAQLHHVVIYHRRKAEQRRTERDTSFGR